MSDSRGKKIIISKDGPYLVSGDIPLTVQIISTNREGQSWEWKKGRSFQVKSDYRLCRCGYSKDMPFCDDSHQHAMKSGIGQTYVVAEPPAISRFATGAMPVSSFMTDWSKDSYGGERRRTDGTWGSGSAVHIIGSKHWSYQVS
jgi:CDGSH-type Zn-finger protein